MLFMFPGQGSQYVGMGKNLYENFDVAKKMMDSANEILGFDIVKLMFEGPEEELKKTLNTQPAIFLVSVVADAVLKEKGYEPTVVAGHSVGEYAALCSAGVVSFEDGLRLVRKRGEFMYEVKGGAMLAVVGLSKDMIEEACAGKDAWISLFNTDTQIVCSGTEEAIDQLYAELSNKAKEAGIRRCKLVKLKVSGPFHCPLMKKPAEKLASEIEKVEFKEPKVDVVPNVTAKPTRDVDVLKKALIDQMIEPVRWWESVMVIKESGVDKAFEVGPGKVLKGMVRRLFKEVVSFPDDGIDKV